MGGAPGDWGRRGRGQRLFYEVARVKTVFNSRGVLAIRLRRRAGGSCILKPRGYSLFCVGARALAHFIEDIPFYFFALTFRRILLAAMEN